MNFFNSVIGQQQAVDLLTQAVKRDRVAPAYLFAGSPGIGRKLTAKCFINLLFCQGLPPEKQQRLGQQLTAGNHPDLLWVEPTYLHKKQLLTAQQAQEAGLKRKSPPQIRIEQIRDLSEFLSRPPLEAIRCVVVIENAQTMAEGAANALLKTLEEPGRATLILIAPDADSLLPTLVSRCQRIPFLRLSTENVTQILAQEGYDEILQDEALIAIAQGSPGTAITAWETLQTIPTPLLDKLKSPPTSPLDAIQLAKEVDQELESDTQLWLIEYLQYHYWQQTQQASILDQLEKARRQLISYVQSRLVWECTFLHLVSNPVD
jgi:DNA polymerase-3 subunit delta'